LHKSASARVWRVLAAFGSQLEVPARCGDLNYLTLGLFLRVEEDYESLVYRRWLWFAVVSVCLGACILWRVYVWVWEAFPDGYMIT